MAKAKERGGYERERVHLTADAVARAMRLIDEGRVPGRGIEFADTAKDATGLTLRVTKASGTWYLRHRRGTIRLGGTDVMDLQAARIAAARARLDFAAGFDPKFDAEIFERSLGEGTSLPEAVELAYPPFEPRRPERTEADRRRDGPWEWRDLVDLFLEHHLPTLREGWDSQYERALRLPEFAEIAETPVSDVTLADFERVRDALVRNQAPSTASRAMANARAALDWGHSDHSGLCGWTEQDVPWWSNRAKVRYKAQTREHTPTVTELVRTILVAEHCRALGGTDQETTPGTIAALWAVVLTAQRTGALGGTRRDGVIPVPDHPGWLAWTWTGEEMKGGTSAARPHGLPIPPEALAIFARFERDNDSNWLFPSRAAGKHVTSDGLNQLLYRLQGKTKAGKKGAVTVRKRDWLRLVGVRHWTPHDARRTLSSYLADEELGGAGSAILAHSSGKDTEEARIEDITRRVYARAQRFPLKAKGMAAWVRHVLDTYERERPVVERMLRAAPPVEAPDPTPDPEPVVRGPGRPRKPKAERKPRR
ncbi:integrase arm-type DNA-binding domain-containing protein [Methylobacterium ajmalii]|nr:integrase arm-type DNA-binding domain-containing protein [Methylobacterium ajmalii]MBK3401095.1 integrase arm-type DNA-binding domain-containing protein [Methylobacterium ajmalii]MBK3411299.1 integrase arm-type DNA-binding domain-containing protein [Methylobacterium ajmalii]MBK3422820.1 integrase arm-type DNA-binding domain-containing protein [Methylobacterium ajmalii]MBZ6414551.1 integrase arm-type DNA-binding domain-containing protein [Methylobacterium sp.]